MGLPRSIAKWCNYENAAIILINNEDLKSIYARSYSVWIQCTIMKCQTSNICPQIVINQIIIPTELCATLCLMQTNFAHHLPVFPTSLFP